MIIACTFYAGYTVAIRSRPQVPGLVFFSALAMVACLVSLPLLAIEVAQGGFVLEAPKGWLILLYVAIGPSILSQLFFMRAVELIGPGRAGVFVNLVPVFAPILAVLILGETAGALSRGGAAAGARRHLHRRAAGEAAELAQRRRPPAVATAAWVASRVASSAFEPAR